ncbi:VOC family protein [Pedobacter sp.]|uniref:VOC family protein n=1 Tax=Pedobacter sp. TaxID=1411316 RepID=UPI003D7F7271
MFKYAKTFSSFSVNDLQTAKEFYSNTLGLEITDDPMGVLALNLGGQKIIIYPKDNHEPATFTVLNFMVPHIETTVNELRSAGVTFEQYDVEGLKTDENGISRGIGAPTISWFKDPAGNILSIIEIESKIS